MATIQITSNPYQKTITYRRLDQEKNEWVEIDYNTAKGSKLLSKELTSGFFPFYAKRIIDVIVEEFGVSGELLTILFEGSDDEYLELEAVCKQEKYEIPVVTEKTDVRLENARDILPEVISLFREMSPLVLHGENKAKIQRDLGRFYDASSDVVPICVLGNYSAGKSTFINALIGSEILPSGSEPITAKVYKISKSKYPDRAHISCKYLEKDITISFTDTDVRFDCGMANNPLIDAVKEALVEVEHESIPVMVNRALSVINDYEDSSNEVEISDLIEVEIPFINGVLANSQHPFVLFDTPGSNSASNAKHLEVLKQAMANMTNGLPIFLCTPDSLDSTDNENLYHIIRSMEELDNRFTMIVVNKADIVGVQRRTSTSQDQTKILSQAVPRNLYSGGLFFVSSVLGLGAKTGGVFTDYDYEDIYDAQVVRYQDPENRHYRTLYASDIMPAQIKHRADELAKMQSDLVYTNSGLFTIETEIETFAGKYAAYNKCFQSQMFLQNVIRITDDKIASDVEKRDNIRKDIIKKLEDEKSRLIREINKKSEEQNQIYTSLYDDHMGRELEQVEAVFSTEDLKEQEKVFIAEQETALGYDDCQMEAKKSWGTIADNLKANAKNVTAKDFRASMRTIVEGIRSDINSTVDNYKTQIDTKHQADRIASDRLLQYVSQTYDTVLASRYEELTASSKTYWTEKTEELRKILIEIVAGSHDVLTDERRAELENIIITYEQLSFSENSADAIFGKGEFERRIRIGNQVFKLSDHLNIDKLTKAFNTNMSESLQARCSSIKESHKDSAYNWIDNLLEDIFENIVEYSPELSYQAEQIRTMTETIDELNEKQQKLAEYTRKLGAMMDWKYVEA